MPNSITRLVEATRKEIAFTGCAPLMKSERVAARAAKEQEEEMNSKKPGEAGVARAAVTGEVGHLLPGDQDLDAGGDDVAENQRPERLP
jgi:hypothetical protein